MIALHLSHRDVDRYSKSLEKNHNTSVLTPICVGASKPTGYSPSWVHKPLSAMNMFFLYKNEGDVKPTHNAWLMKTLNPKSSYRDLWSELVVLTPAIYKKQKGEIRMRVCASLLLSCCLYSVCKE
jgi:hypothetical protein